MTARAARLPADARREAILEAALPLFAEKGFEAVTTKEIAEAAGVSEALLYRHFASKHEIWGSMEMSCVALAEHEARRIQELPDATSTLVMAVYAVMWRIQIGGRRTRLGALIPRLLMRSLLSDGAFARSFLRASAAFWVDKIEGSLRAAVAAGDLRGLYEEGRVRVWLAHHLSAALVFYALPDDPVVDYLPGAKTSPERLFEESVLFALRGMGLTEDAISRHYNPQAFAFLVQGGGQ